MTKKNTVKSTQTTNENLVVIVPCFNEEENVEATVEDIYKTVPRLPLSVRVILVNDGSTDGTLNKIKLLSEQYPNCEFRTSDINRGLGYVVTHLYDEIEDGTWVTVFPGDNEILFSSIENHIAVRDKYDLILGYLQNAIVRTVVRRAASRVFTTVVNSLYGFDFNYLNGMKMYKVDIFRGIEVLSTGHAFNAELFAKAILRKPDLRIGEVPFVSRGRGLGTTKAFSVGSIINSVNDVRKGYQSVAQYRDSTKGKAK